MDKIWGLQYKVFSYFYPYPQEKNKIEGIKQANGRWCFDQDKLKGMAVEFFVRLYAKENAAGSIQIGRGRFLGIDQLDYGFLTKPYSCEEVHRALIQMSLFKAPGLDGFQAGFYQQMWDVVRESV